MRERVLTVFIFMLILFSSIPLALVVSSNETMATQPEIINQESKVISSKTTNPYPIMRMDENDFQTWKRDYEQAKKAEINPVLQAEIVTTEDFSILELLKYNPDERDQHWCGNCWAWPATSVIAIALNVQEGIYDRLSVQYINSCGTLVGVDCCEGGNLNIFTRFYQRTDKAIPWSNENAEWRDRFAQCNTPCESIETEPNYPISAIYPETIETHGISKEEAIENIKNVLHQQKGVYFSWILPDMDYREDFSTFWDRQSEESIYEIDWDCGSEYSEETGGGHAVLCVGYHDEEGTENDYWIMLNSWGTASGRPNGLFRVNMHMDYDCIILYNDYEYYQFDFETMDISFGTEEEAPDPPVIDGPNSIEQNTEYTYEFSTIDYQGDAVYIMIDWGDGETTDWIGPLDSEEVIQRNHTWQERGTFDLRARAKDDRGKISLWSTLEVSMSKTKVARITFIELLRYYFPLFSLFNY